MDCCSVNGLVKEFDSKEAQGKLRAYLKKGLSSWTRQVRDAVQAQGVSGSSIVEIGCGIGALHLELIKAGAEKAIGIDVSPAQIEAAQTLAKRLSLEDTVEYHVMDFAEGDQETAEADIVILDSVICCYPRMKELVTAPAQHARRLCVLAYPRITWWTKLLEWGANTFVKIRRAEFRGFLHSPEEVSRTVTSQGFTRVSYKTYGPLGIWQVYVFQRQ